MPLLSTCSRLRPAGSPSATGIAIAAAFLRWARVGAGRSASTSLAIRLAALLLEFLHLALHELASPRILPVLHLIKSAIRATLPTLGIGLLAGGAENAFGQRHRSWALALRLAPSSGRSSNGRRRGSGGGRIVHSDPWKELRTGGRLWRRSSSSPEAAATPIVGTMTGRNRCSDRNRAPRKCARWG